jgi:hypothetical protein
LAQPLLLEEYGKTVLVLEENKMKGYFVADIMRGLKNINDCNKLKKLIKTVLDDMFDDEKLVNKYKKMIGYEQSEKSREEYHKIRKEQNKAKTKNIGEDIVDMFNKIKDEEHLVEDKRVHCSFCGESFNTEEIYKMHRKNECSR